VSTPAVASPEAARDPAPQPRPARVRLDFIEGMRAVGALMVLLNHGYAQIWETEGARPIPSALSWLSLSMVTGHLAVSVFICISGFCLMLPVARGDGTLPGGGWQFFKRRARRILPPYYAALLLTLLLIVTVIGKRTGTLWDVCIRIRLSDLASHFLLLQHFFGTGRINYAFWSISLEWQIYFLFPLLVIAFRRIGMVVTTVATLAIGCAISAIFNGPFDRLHRANLHYVGLFTLGMVAACIAFRRDGIMARLRDRVPWTACAGVFLVTQAVLICWWGMQRGIAHWLQLDVLAGAGAASLLIAASSSGNSVVRSVFQVRPLVWVGHFSYSLYLIHAPLLQLFWQYVIVPLKLTEVPAFFCGLLLGTPLILLAARAFYRFFEAPFLNAPRPVAKAASAGPA
jgi:peptidoglycan/LPS O-acetylase OafA/YrhL